MKKSILYISMILLASITFVLILTSSNFNFRNSSTINKKFIERTYKKINLQDSVFFSLPEIFVQIIKVSDSGFVFKNDDFLSISKLNKNLKLSETIRLDSIFSDANIDHIQKIEIFFDQSIIFSGNTASIFFTTDFSKNSFSKKLNLNYNYSNAIAINENEIRSNGRYENFRNTAQSQR